jgi:diaminopimelate epimerase
MDVAFLKLQASANDYICLDMGKSPSPEADLLPQLARKICNRRRGVGAMGMIVMERASDERITVRIFSAQGEEAEECGAALQCAARYAFDTGLVTAKEFVMYQGRQSVRLEIIDSVNIRQDMGPPLALGGDEELKERPDAIFARPVIVDNHEYSCTPVVLDSPQAVLFVTGFGGPLQHLARTIEQAPLFPDGAGSVVFVRLFSREELQVRAYKKNEHELHACPRVAAASLVAASLNGFTEREALVHLRGGDLFVEWDETTNHVFFTGPAEYVFSGSYYFEE